MQSLALDLASYQMVGCTKSSSSDMDLLGAALLKMPVESSSYLVHISLFKSQQLLLASSWLTTFKI